MGVHKTCLILCWFLAAAVAMGQGQVENVGPLVVPIQKRDLHACFRLIGFDADQQAASMALYNGYRAALQEAGSRAAEAIAAEADDPGLHISKAYIREAEEIERQLLDDFRALCSKRQAIDFPRVERSLRRAQGSRMVVAPGDGIDLVALLHELRVPRTPAVDEAVLRWETEYDRVGMERRAAFRRAFDTVLTIPKDAPHDNKYFIRFYRELYAASARGRDITRRTVRELVPLLPADAAATLVAEVQRRTYPRIFANSDAARALSAAAAMDDLAVDQRARVASLAAAFEREAAPINERWARTADHAMDEAAEDFLFHEPPADPNHPFVAAKAERWALEHRTLDKLRRILTPEQAARLPSPKGPDELPEYLREFGWSTLNDDWREFASKH